MVNMEMTKPLRWGFVAVSTFSIFSLIDFLPQKHKGNRKKLKITENILLIEISGGSGGGGNLVIVKITDSSGKRARSTVLINTKLNGRRIILLIHSIAQNRLEINLTIGFSVSYLLNHFVKVKQINLKTSIYI